MGSPQQNHSDDSPYQEELEGSEREYDTVEDAAVASQPSQFLPYSAITIPVMWSTMVDHSASSSLLQHEWDFIAWQGYNDAIVLLKSGPDRQALGLPPASKDAGSLYTIEDVDMYFNVVNKVIYVASEFGLITVPDYLNMCGIALERRIRFDGRIPKWAKTIFDAGEKRYVTEVFHEDPLPLRSEVHVLDTLESDQEPGGLWGWVYSVETRKTLNFPMTYTSEERPGQLDLPDLRPFFILPTREEPTPQEVGDALFKQAQDTRKSGGFKPLSNYLKNGSTSFDHYTPLDVDNDSVIFTDDQSESASSLDENNLILPEIQHLEELDEDNLMPKCDHPAESGQNSERQLREAVKTSGIEMSNLPEVPNVKPSPLVPALQTSKTGQQAATTKQLSGLQEASASYSGSPTPSAKVAPFSLASAVLSLKRKGLMGSPPSAKKPKGDANDNPDDVRAEDYPHFDAPANDLITDQTRVRESLSNDQKLGKSTSDQAEQLSENTIAAVAGPDAGSGEGAKPEAHDATLRKETDNFDIYIPAYEEHMDEMRRRNAA